MKERRPQVIPERTDDDKWHLKMQSLVGFYPQNAQSKLSVGGVPRPARGSRG